MADELRSTGRPGGAEARLGCRWYITSSNTKVNTGETVLVNAAAGGVGIAAVQLAKGTFCRLSAVWVCLSLFLFIALGAKVIAAAGSQSKLDICKQHGGADYIVDYTNPDWQKEVLKITGGKGVDVVYDPVGKITGMSAFRANPSTRSLSSQNP